MLRSKTYPLSFSGPTDNKTLLESWMTGGGEFMEGPGAPGVASSPRHWAHSTAGHTAAFAHLGKKQRLAEDNL